MIGAPRRALALLLIAALASAGIALWARHRNAPEAEARLEARRPALMLLTSLPLMFGEQLALDQPGSAALSLLRKRYRIVPISVTSQVELAKARLLLMAQPLAQPPNDLVSLDRWVRSGGRLLLLADPLLEWPSTRPLGDPLRPPAMFMDTGLLGHWGLRLDAPDAPGRRRGRIGNFAVMTGSPGVLVPLQSNCRVENDGLVARCAVGRGRVTVIADADFLDVGADALRGPNGHNLDALTAELSVLRGR